MNKMKKKKEIGRDEKSKLKKRKKQNHQDEKKERKKKKKSSEVFLRFEWRDSTVQVQSFATAL